MPPLRFKAVCTETGREFGAAGLYYSGVEYDKWDNPVGQTWAIDFEDENDDPTETDVSKVELCQSTGLTDSRGQEVFFDDILVDPSQHMQSFVVMFDADMVCAKLKTTPNSAWVQPMMDVKNMFVIGNKWMPQAELQARAEAVSNG